MRINFVSFIVSSFEGCGHKNIRQVRPPLILPYLASFLANQTNTSLFYDLPPHLKSLKKGSVGMPAPASQVYWPLLNWQNSIESAFVELRELMAHFIDFDSCNSLSCNPLVKFCVRHCTYAISMPMPVPMTMPVFQWPCLQMVLFVLIFIWRFGCRENAKTVFPKQLKMTDQYDVCDVTVNESIRLRSSTRRRGNSVF